MVGRYIEVFVLELLLVVISPFSYPLRLLLYVVRSYSYENESPCVHFDLRVFRCRPIAKQYYLSYCYYLSSQSNQCLGGSYYIP